LSFIEGQKKITVKNKKKKKTKNSSYSVGVSFGPGRLGNQVEMVLLYSKLIQKRFEQSFGSSVKCPKNVQNYNYDYPK
jgi:hypothetical protein